MGFAVSCSFSLPSRISISFSANSNAVPGPLDVTTLPSTTTLSSALLHISTVCWTLQYVIRALQWQAKLMPMMLNSCRTTCPKPRHVVWRAYSAQCVGNGQATAQSKHLAAHTTPPPPCNRKGGLQARLWSASFSTNPGCDVAATPSSRPCACSTTAGAAQIAATSLPDSFCSLSSCARCWLSCSACAPGMPPCVHATMGGRGWCAHMGPCSARPMCTRCDAKPRKQHIQRIVAVVDTLAGHTATALQAQHAAYYTQLGSVNPTAPCLSGPAVQHCSFAHPEHLPQSVHGVCALAAQSHRMAPCSCQYCRLL